MIDRLVWIDLEMTGLDPATDVVLEVAALVTDSELEPLGEGVDLVIGHSKETLDRMGDVVREMHAKSGLTDAVLTSIVTLEQAEKAVLDLVREHAPEARTVPLCGNSIATDRTFITAYMPALEAHLHYRMIDVSSIKELARRWYPKAYYAAPVKGGGHRALADILESVAELRYYREAVFKAPDEVPSPADEPAPADTT